MVAVLVDDLAPTTADGLSLISMGLVADLNNDQALMLETFVDRIEHARIDRERRAVIASVKVALSIRDAGVSWEMPGVLRSDTARVRDRGILRRAIAKIRRRR